MMAIFVSASAAAAVVIRNGILPRDDASSGRINLRNSTTVITIIAVILRLMPEKLYLEDFFIKL